MGSRRYWIVVGVLAAFVGLIVFIATVEPSDPVASEALSTTSDAPSTTAPARSATTTTTTVAPTTTTQSLSDPLPTTTTDPLPPATLPGLPQTYGGPDWLGLYPEIPPVLSGQVLDLDDDGEPDVALFGAAESPLIYPIEDEYVDELTAAQTRIEQLTIQIDELKQVTEGLQEELDNNGERGITFASPTTPEQEGDEVVANSSNDTTTTTTIKSGEGAQSGGLTPTQESLLLALISTGGVVLAGIGAPVMTQWGKRRFGTSDE